MQLLLVFKMQNVFPWFFVDFYFKIAKIRHIKINWCDKSWNLDYKAEQYFESNIIINFPLSHKSTPVRTMSEPTPGTEQLNLKVKSQDGEEVFFKIKATTQLKKLMDAYCQRQSVSYFSNSALYYQCAISFWWIKTSRNSNSQRIEHGKWWWNWCSRVTGRRFNCYLISTTNPKTRTLCQKPNDLNLDLL